MKKLMILLSCAFVAVPILAVTTHGNTWAFDDEDAAICKANGGCIPITREALARIIKAAKSCGDVGMKT